YSRVAGFLPRRVFAEPSETTRGFSALTGTVLSGGAAVCYAAQNPVDVDIFASFYDSALNLWSQPRLLTQDTASESSLSVGALGDELLISYMKTETIYTATQAIIDGTPVEYNIPEPGQNDIYL